MEPRFSSCARLDDDGHAVVVQWSLDATCWRVVFRGSTESFLEFFAPFVLSRGPDAAPYAVGRCEAGDTDAHVASVVGRLPPPPPSEPGPSIMSVEAALLN